MKVFEIITEYTEINEIIEQRSFVTHKTDRILDVTEHYTKWCDEFEHDLKSVREVLTVVEQLG